jgi:hypothetical protein
MTCHLNIAGEAGKRRRAIQPSNSGRADRGNLLLFPSGHRLEAVKPEQGDEAAHCPNGSSAKHYREAAPEDRAIYRKWIFGMILFYSTLLLISCVVAIVVDSSASSTKLTSLSAQQIGGSLKSN